MQSWFDDTNGGCCCQSALLSSLYLQQEGNLLACFPSNILTESQDKKEAELHSKLFAFELLQAFAARGIAEGREGREADELFLSQCHIWGFPHHSIFSLRF